MTLGFVLVTTSAEREFYVYSHLRDVNNITGFYHVGGEYNLVLKVSTQDIDGLQYILTQKVRKIPGVINTETFIVTADTENLYASEDKDFIGFMLARTQPRREKNIFKRICCMDEIIEAYLVLGKYDIIAKICTTTLEELVNKFAWKIKHDPSITEFKTLIKRKNVMDIVSSTTC